jgi:hypothetical protein
VCTSGAYEPNEHSKLKKGGINMIRFAVAMHGFFISQNIRQAIIAALNFLLFSVVRSFKHFNSSLAAMVCSYFISFIKSISYVKVKAIT